MGSGVSWTDSEADAGGRVVVLHNQNWTVLSHHSLAPWLLIYNCEKEVRGGCRKSWFCSAGAFRPLCVYFPWHKQQHKMWGTVKQRLGILPLMLMVLVSNPFPAKVRWCISKMAAHTGRDTSTIHSCWDSETVFWGGKKREKTSFLNIRSYRVNIYPAI